MTAPLPARGPLPDDVRIGLWGAPGSGKTTYLASLNVAVNRWHGPGNWIMNGVTDESSEFLTHSTNLLTRQHVFHNATSDPQNVIFRFTGTEAPPPVRRGVFGRAKPVAPQRVAFELDVLDVPGWYYRSNGHPVEQQLDDEFSIAGAPGGQRVTSLTDTEDQLLDHLEMCGGIIYLFDPVRDARTGDAFDFFHRMLEKLARRIFEQERYQGTYLPQHLAVCVTKFDDPEIYKAARRYGLTVQSEHPPHLPLVPDGYADEFFQRLCHESPNGTADLVRGALSNHFDPQRLRVFVTSAIGFYVGDGRRFRPNDYANIKRGDDGQDRIRGGVFPINVLEPLLWIHSRLRNAR